MKIEMELEKKNFKREDGQEISYYVIKKKLLDNTYLEIPVKSDKARILLYDLSIEQQKR